MRFASEKIEVCGAERATELASKYIRFLKGQKNRNATLLDSDDDGDLTTLLIPQDCMGYVNGERGRNLRSLEADWGVIMLFVDDRRTVPAKAPAGVSAEDAAAALKAGGVLAIFGDEAGRRSAEIKVMATVDIKDKKWFAASFAPHSDPEDAPWGLDVVDLADNLSYALGQQGKTRKKLARAAGCILEYIGSCAVIAGPPDARKRGRDYLGWLIAQKAGPISVPDIEGRDDVIVVSIPKGNVAYVAGRNSNSLRRVENDTGTFCFIDAEPDPEADAAATTRRVLVFGAKEKGRTDARNRILNLSRTKDRKTESERKRRRSRSRSHSPRHSRRRSSSSSSSPSSSSSSPRSPKRAKKDPEADDVEIKPAAEDERKKKSSSSSAAGNDGDDNNRDRSGSRSRSRSRSRSGSRDSRSRTPSGSPSPRHDGDDSGLIERDNNDNNNNDSDVDDTHKMVDDDDKH